MAWYTSIDVSEGPAAIYQSKLHGNTLHKTGLIKCTYIYTNQQ
jgi:hypothetical protein